MIENNMLLVLTHDNKIKTSQTQYLIKNNVTLFLEWHCEVFDHTKTITSQLGTTGHTACGNKSRTCDVAICACPTDINLPKAIDKDTLINFRDLVSNITKYSIIDDTMLTQTEILLRVVCMDYYKTIVLLLIGIY